MHTNYAVQPTFQHDARNEVKWGTLSRELSPYMVAIYEASRASRNACSHSYSLVTELYDVKPRVSVVVQIPMHTTSRDSNNVHQNQWIGQNLANSNSDYANSTTPIRQDPGFPSEEELSLEPGLPPSISALSFSPSTTLSHQEHQLLSLPLTSRSRY